MTPYLAQLESSTLEENYARMKEYIYSPTEHISFSAVSMYLKCPRQYYYKYVRAEKPQHVTDHMLFGIAVHKAVAGFYAYFKETGELLGADKLQADFEAIFEGVCKKPRYPVKWARNKDGSEKTQEQWREQGVNMVRVFAEEAQPKRIVAIELPFMIALLNPRTGEELPNLVGAIDLIELDDEGQIHVSDLKTAAKNWGKNDIEQDLQTSLYTFVLRELGIIKDSDTINVRVDVLTKTKTPKLHLHHSVRLAWDRQRIQQLIADVHHAIESKVFHVKPSWMCGGCQFREVCDSEP